MSERTVYGFCENNCRHPVYTRAEMLSLLQQAVESGSLSNLDPDYAVIKALIDMSGGEDVKFWTGTEAEFEALDMQPTMSRVIPRIGEDGVIYICIDDGDISALPTEPLTAKEINAICGTLEPVAYLYNGVRLPPLPELPHADALIGVEGKTYYLVCKENRLYCNSKGAILVHATPAVFRLSGNTWEQTDESCAVYVVWANYDVVDYTTEDIFIAFSEPVPVYE